MKLVFAHDHKLRLYKNKYYTTGGFADEIIERYTSIFDNMTFICRATTVQLIKGESVITSTKINIVPVAEKIAIPDQSIINCIKKEVANTDRVIVRLPSLLGIYTALIAYKKRIPVYVEVVGSAFGSYWYKNALGKIVSVPLEILNKYIVKKADYVLYVSENYLQKKYPTNGQAIGCSDVVLGNRDHRLLETRINKIMDRKEKRFILGTLAQIDYIYKGHATVFKAIKELKKRGYIVEYRLAGSGSADYLKKLAAQLEILDNIVFCGQLKHEDVNEWIDNIDIYIQPSLTEGIPRSVIEALYRGCPTIVSSAGGMYELIDKGWIFNKGNVKSLMKIISEIDNEKLIRTAERNYSYSEKFNYLELCNKRKSFCENFRDLKES